MSGTYQLSRNNIIFLIIKVTLFFNLFGFCYSQNSKIEALYDLDNYIKFIETKNIGIVSNQSSVFLRKIKNTSSRFFIKSWSKYQSYFRT